MSVPVLLAAILLLILLRIPIAFAILAPSVLYIMLSDAIGLVSVGTTLVSGINSFPLLAVPLFILVGNLANVTGATERIMTAAQAVVGHLRGGLGYVNVLTSFGFSWVSGAAVADAAAMGKTIARAMISRGYSPSFTMGITGASSLISPVMPPSVPAVLYGVASGVSIGAMFLAGIVPALLLTAFLLLVCFLYGRSNPSLSHEQRTVSEVGRVALKAAPAAFAPIVILGGILGGVFTPTEAAGIAVVYLLLVGLAFGQLRARPLWNAFGDTARGTAEILIIVASTALLGQILVLEQVPQAMTEAAQRVTDSPAVFLLLAVVLLVLIGMFVEPLSAILIVTPILTPVAAAYEIAPVHLGVVVIMSLLLGLITPPVGLVLFVLSSATERPLSEAIAGSLRLIPVLLALLVLIALFPSLSTLLPELIN